MDWKDKEFIERRKYVRLDVKTKVRFKLGKKKIWPSNKVTAITKNLCVEGIRFISDKRLEPGSAIRLELSIPGEIKPWNSWI